MPGTQYAEMDLNTQTKLNQMDNHLEDDILTLWRNGAGFVFEGTGTRFNMGDLTPPEEGGFDRLAVKIGKDTYVVIDLTDPANQP